MKCSFWHRFDIILLIYLQGIWYYCKPFGLIVVCFVWFNVFFLLFANQLKIFLWFTDCIALKIPVWGFPIWIYPGGGSSWIFHTLSWSAVHCEWGTTSVCLGINYVCSAPGGLPVINRGPKCLHKKKSLLSVASFEYHHQNLWKKSCRFKPLMDVIGQISMK